MKKQIQLISSLIASFITVELELNDVAEEAITEVCENEGNDTLEEIIDFFKAQGRSVALVGETNTTVIYNILLFEPSIAKKYAEDSPYSGMVLTMPIILGNEKPT